MGKRGHPLQPSSQRLARYRWRVLLPMVMCVVSVFLMARAKPTPFNSGVEAPERIINSLINGPGFYLTGHLRFPIHALNEPLGDNTNRLFGIVGFWFLIGISIDRRRNGQRLGSYHPIPAGILFTFGLLCVRPIGRRCGAHPVRSNYMATNHRLPTPNDPLYGIGIHAVDGRALRLLWQESICRSTAEPRSAIVVAMKNLSMSVMIP